MDFKKFQTYLSTKKPRFLRRRRKQQFNAKQDHILTSHHTQTLKQDKLQTKQAVKQINEILEQNICPYQKFESFLTYLQSQNKIAFLSVKISRLKKMYKIYCRKQQYNKITLIDDVFKPQDIALSVLQGETLYQFDSFHVDIVKQYLYNAYKTSYIAQDLIQIEKQIKQQLEALQSTKTLQQLDQLTFKKSYLYDLHQEHLIKEMFQNKIFTIFSKPNSLGNASPDTKQAFIKFRDELRQKIQNIRFDEGYFSTVSQIQFSQQLNDDELLLYNYCLAIKRQQNSLQAD